MLRNSGRRPERIHIVGGILDPDCPICRAHPMDESAFGIETAGPWVMMAQPFVPKEGCSCPLCAAARSSPFPEDN